MVYLATMMIPFQALIVPLFVEMKSLGLINTYLGAILPTIASAFGVFLLRQAMSTVPYELDQAATLDGAGHFRVFFQIMLPLIRPALATLAVFAFLNTWNSLLWPLIILRDPLMQTLPVALSSLQGQYSTQWDVRGGSVVGVVPMSPLRLRPEIHRPGRRWHRSRMTGPSHKHHPAPSYAQYQRR